MKAHSTILVMYVPALHQSYIAFFEKYRGKADALYIIDEDVIADFPRMQREIRAIGPEIARTFVETLGIFPSVVVANKAKLKELSKQAELKVVMSNEQVSDTLRKTYFAKHKVKQERFFLRYDENTVKAARQEIAFDGQISIAAFHQHIFDKLAIEKEKSSDWFLRVAAAIVVDGKVLALDHNKRMPTSHSLWTIGDPRNYVEYGTDTHQRTALHAEQALIALAARAGIRIEGADFYVTAFPCPDCAQVIAYTGVKCVYFQNGYSQLSSDELFKQRGIELIQVKESV